MSLHPALSDSPSRARSARRALSAVPGEIDGLSGRVELRRASGGYLEVWPRPTPESQRELYGSKFYEEDKSSYLADVERDRDYWDAIWTMRRRSIEQALPETARRLLDVGCSGGFLLDHFRQHGWEPFGIEPSRHAARWAQEHFGLEVFCGELLEFPGEPHEVDDGEAGAAFDAIHCAQVLEHVLEPEACVERIASLLVPGGVAYVEVPNDFNVFQQIARESLGKSAWWVAPDHHLNYFDYDSLAGVLARHGLVEIDRVASFPIEMFLLMGEDYIGHPEVGSACHARRMRFERSMIDTGRLEELQRLYRSFAQASVGRTCGILARKV